MSLKMGVAVMLTVAMVLTAGLSFSYAETSGSVFTDIDGHWAESAIKEASDLKIVGGYTDGTFLPDNLIKREEFFKLLANILTEKPDTSNTKIQFTDVNENEWYVPTIEIAVAAGITSGYGDGTFGIGLMISRQEAAKVAGSVIPAYGVDNETGVEIAADKDKIADWAYKYVDLMFKKGYMKGDTEGNFRPTTALTRAEAAVILLNIKKNETVIGANTGQLSATACMAAHNGQEGIFTAGSGTKSDPYEIATAEQLNHMRMHTTEGAFFVLTKNIAITKDYAVTPPAIGSDAANWTDGNFQPIGSKAEPFKGSLFGNGYTISGLIISGSAGTSSNKTGGSYAGLFGYLAEGSSVTDLIIDASTITGNQYTGAVAGYNEGTIKNCQLGKKGIVNGKTYTGGIAGYSTAALSSLRNRGTVTGAGANTGGIAGYIDAPGISLLYCQNEGAVTGNESTGGVAGLFLSSASTGSVIKECYNKGTVTAEQFSAGGIVGTASGENYRITISNCSNSGTVTGAEVSGGISGLLKTKKAAISDCNNAGAVDGYGAGGIAGNNQGLITDCYNSGSVKGKLDAGGIAALQSNGDGRITRSYNEGTVTAKSYGGGIVGENGSKVDNCYNSGKVSADDNAGGIAGASSKTVNNVYCAGTVSGEYIVGALLGRNTGSLSNAYWLDRIGDSGIGLSEGSLSLVSKITHEELSGQVKIKTLDGYRLLVDVMNANSAADTSSSDNANPDPVWEYLYTVTGSGGTVISDGGGIVPPLDNSSYESKGNTIKPGDLNTKYLYPSIIN